jgi:hypothetical protein
MRIKVNYAAVLKLTRIRTGETVDLPEGTTVSQLLSDSSVKEEHKKFIQVFVDEKKRDIHHILKDGEVLSLYLPVGGGQR